MRNGIVVAALAVMASAGVASAQVTGVVTQSTAQLQFDPAITTIGVGGLLNVSGQNIAGVVYDGAASTSQYQVTTLLQPDDIEFANGATASGAYQYTTTTTSIGVTFTNDGPDPVRPQLQSTITPGGFGIYLGATAGCDLSATAGCAQVTPASRLTFADLTPDSDAPPGAALGGATFSFTVTNGQKVIESLSGSVALFYNAADPASPIVVTSLGGLAATLTNFGLETPAGSSSAIGYNWDQTNLLVDFPPGLLAPGASDKLTYTTVVSSYALADCAAACELVAYGGFGDPIATGGGSGGADAIGRSDVSLFGTPFDGGSDLIKGVTYTDFRYALPTYSDGVLSLLLISSVPEPASWALMLLGSGLLGQALRRRKASDRRVAAR